MRKAIPVFISAFGLVILVFASVLASHANANTSIVVNTDADNVTTDGLCTLREAITNANSDSDTTDDCAAGSGADLITFAGDYTVTLGSALPDVDGDLTITGNGQKNSIVQASICNPITLPGGCTPADYRVFTIISGTVTLEDMTMRHGNCPGVAGACTQNSGHGGSIWNSADLTLDKVVIQSSQAISNGGAIYNSGGNLTVQNGSLIENNVASINGGGIDSNSDLIISASTLSHNTAEYGGGIHNNGGETTIDATTVYSNTANEGGGGIYNNEGVLAVQNNSLIDDNVALGDGGGGILFDGDASGETTTVSYSTVSNNESTGDYGAGIYASDDGGSNGALLVQYSTISGNVNNDDEGGGVVTYGPTMTITHSAIINNVSLEEGDAGVGAWGPTTIINSTISGNLAPDATDIDDGAGGLGVYDATVNLYYVTITNNSGGYSGGISDWERTDSFLNIFNSLISGNTGTDAPDCNFSVGTLDFQSAPSILEDTTGCSAINKAKVLMENPLLGPLADNGGETETHALLLGSPAIDLIPDGEYGCGTIVTDDQRGVVRPIDGNLDSTTGCDLGAFELGTTVFLPVVLKE